MTTKLTDILSTTQEVLSTIETVVDTTTLLANKIPDALPAEARLAGRIASLKTLPSTRHRRRVLARLQAELAALDSQ